jgi:hypothetical protein
MKIKKVVARRMSLPFQDDHWRPGFNFDVEEWFGGDHYETLAICRSLEVTRVVFADACVAAVNCRRGRGAAPRVRALDGRGNLSANEKGPCRERQRSLKDCRGFQDPSRPAQAIWNARHELLPRPFWQVYRSRQRF